MIISRYPIIAITLSLFFAAGCSAQQKVGIDDSAAEALRASPWGELQNGLQCRVTVQKEIEQGMPLEAKIEFQCEPDNLKEGVKKLNTFLIEQHLKLTLTSKEKGSIFNIKPYDPTAGGGPEPMDNGKYAVLLDGQHMEPLKTSIPLVVLRDSLAPGSYTCSVEFSFSEKPSPWWYHKAGDWKEVGFWSGTISSGQFELKILKETPKTKTFFLPKRLRLEKGLQIKYRKEDAQEVVLPVRNGFFLAAKYYHNDNSNLYKLSGPPVPDDVNYIDYWYGYKGGDKHYTLTIEIFETSDPPVHMWSPGPGSGGYKVLWKKSFDIHYTEKEIKALR